MIIKINFIKIYLKILTLILLFFSLGCNRNINDSVVASCENGKVFLLKSMSIEDVKSSVAKAINEKMEYEYIINYTVIANKKESMVIENIKPEDFNKCQLHRVNYRQSYKNFMRK